jgi:hypothetical protein
VALLFFFCFSIARSLRLIELQVEPSKEREGFWDVWYACASPHSPPQAAVCKDTFDAVAIASGILHSLCLSFALLPFIHLLTLHVLSAAGHNWLPHVPPVPGAKLNKSPSSADLLQQIHSHNYRRPEPFRGKRVLVGTDAVCSGPRRK